MKRQKRAKPSPPTTKRVDDPFGSGSLLVSINRNEDCIEFLHSKHLLSQGRYAVACRFRKLYEAVAIGAVPAIDYSRPMVSGSAAGDIFTDDLVSSGQEMVKLTKAIGRGPLSFLILLITPGWAYNDLATRYAALYDLPVRESRGFIRGRLAAVLDDLGRYWQMNEARGLPRVELRGGPISDLVRGVLDYASRAPVYDLRR